MAATAPDAELASAAAGAGAAGVVDGGASTLIWSAFAVSVPVLLAIDWSFLAERSRREVSISSASWQCAFWIVAGLLFNAFVWLAVGSPEGISWLSGYVLEYMLSIDNLFCFHLIFTSYRTPKDQTHRALFFGIGGAVVLRFALFALGASMFNFTFVVHWVFGAILLWSGVKVAMLEEDGDTDHKQNWAVRQISKVLPVEECYAPQAAFFIEVPVPATSPGRCTSLGRVADAAGGPGLAVRRGEAARDVEAALSPVTAGASDAEAAALTPGGGSGDGGGDGETLLVPDSTGSGSGGGGSREGGGTGTEALLRRKVTLLFLVVLTLGAVDLIFAVDSVTAKVAMVTQFDDRVDLALNFTSSAFPMLTLRSLYFLLASLVHVFRLMKYGVGLILVLIGVRLILQSYVAISEAAFCALMLAVFAVSLLASLAVPAPGGGQDVAAPRPGFKASAAEGAAACPGAAASLVVPL